MANDLSALSGMIYSGRGIAAGMTPRGSIFVGYTLTGRSPSSQARRLVKRPLAQSPNELAIETEPTNREELEKGNPALLIYPAIVCFGDIILASNGAQTNLLHESARRDVPEGKENRALAILEDAFEEPYVLGGIDITTFEPDGPNFTPRISACVSGDHTAMHTVRKQGEGKMEDYRPFQLEPGKGRAITTYKGGNEKPLLSFKGDLLSVAIESETAEEIARALYDAVKGGTGQGEDFRVAAAAVVRTKAGDIDVCVVNRHGDNSAAG